MTFGDRLKLLRETKKMTQSRLAEKLNIAKSNITKYEHGDLEPNVKNIVEISRLFDVTTDYLLGAGLFDEHARELVILYRKTILKKLCMEGVITPEMYRKLFSCDPDLCIEFLSSIITKITGTEDEVSFSYSPVISSLGKQLFDTLSREQIDDIPYIRFEEVPRTKEQQRIIEDIQSLPDDEQNKLRDYITMYHRLNPTPVAAGGESTRVQAK